MRFKWFVNFDLWKYCYVHSPNVQLECRDVTIARHRCRLH